MLLRQVLPKHSRIRAGSQYRRQQRHKPQAPSLDQARAFATDRPSFVCPSRARRGPGASHSASPSFQPPCPVPSPHPTRFTCYLNL